LKIKKTFNQPTISKTNSFEANKTPSKPYISIDQMDKRSFQLMNKHRKCLEGLTITSQVRKAGCNQLKSKQIWKWRHNHICYKDGNGLVVESETRNPSGVSYDIYYEGSNLQEWKGTASGQLVSIGLCLGVHDNLENVLAVVKNCSEADQGPIWSFVWLK